MSRAEIAKPYLRNMAYLIYVMEQEEPIDHLLLSAIRYFRNVATYARMDMIREVLSMGKRDFTKRVNRMRDKGWVATEGEYINVTYNGGKELDAMEGWVSYAMNNIKERKPLEQWNKLMK